MLMRRQVISDPADDDDPEDIIPLLNYCGGWLEVLDARDAQFVVSMLKIVERYEPTKLQRKWILDVYRRVKKLDDLRHNKDTLHQTLSKPRPRAGVRPRIRPRIRY